MTDGRHSTGGVPVSGREFGRLGFFITLEGGEGAGKSTQARILSNRLAGLGYDTLTTREPGGSPGAERLRDVLLSGAVAPLGPTAEAIVFSAARIDHLDKTIRPALSQGCVVICDRFADSTRAYQGALGNLDPRLISALEAVTVGPTTPDLTLMLDLPAEVGLDRANRRRGSGPADRFEGATLAFHRGLRQTFLDIAATEPQRCAVIDAMQSPEKVAEQIWSLVESRLLLALKPARNPASGNVIALAAGRRGAEAP